jgi:hypothetical protein
VIAERHACVFEHVFGFGFVAAHRRSCYQADSSFRANRLGFARNGESGFKSVREYGLCYGAAMQTQPARHLASVLARRAVASN